MRPERTTDRGSEPRILDESELDAVGGAGAPEPVSFTSVSNVLKTRHDTAKNSISN